MGFNFAVIQMVRRIPRSTRFVAQMSGRREPGEVVVVEDLCGRKVNGFSAP